MKAFFSACILIVLVAMIGWGNADAGQAELRADLDALDSMHEASMEEASKPLHELAAKYSDALEKRRIAAQNAGDLDGVLKANLEMERVKRADESDASSATSPEIEKLRKTYREQQAKIREQLDARIVNVDREHSQRLEKLVNELTKAGRIEDAQQVRSLRETFISDFKARRSTAGPAAAANPNAKSLAAGSRPGQEQIVEMAAGLKVAFCWIPDGRFMMGSPDDELGREHEESRQRVIISKGFWMTKTETTQALWKAVMGENPSLFKGDDLPVEMISWMDICGDNQRTGGFLGKVNAAAPKGWRFDLPSQAEWEYACRAKTETSLNSGENLTSAAGRCENLDQVGWYVGNSGGKTNPVGLKKPNHWGLHDMHGNVWEFCAGWNGEFPAGSLTDPTGPASGNERINRGGGWTSPPSKCRATRAKGGCKSDEKLQSLGFRLIIRPV